MAVELTIVGVQESADKMRGLGRDLPMAIVRALNRTIFSARTQARRAVSAETGLPAKFAVRGMAIAKADRAMLAAVLRVSERLIPLIAYMGIRGFRSGKGIAGQAFRVGVVPPGSFFAEVGKGRHRGVFRRVGQDRVPIREVMGPTIPRVIIQKRIFEALQEPARAMFEKRLAFETQRILARRGDA